MRYPVQTWAMLLISLRDDVRYWHRLILLISLRVCYAMPGTDIGYAAPRRRERSGGRGRISAAPPPLRCSIPPWPYALS
eukprot:863210-Rhodomonas_salina.1